MPLLRLLIAGLVALVAMAAVFFTAVVVLLGGLAAYVVQLFRPRAGPARSSRREVPRRTDDVIDVESTKVPDERPGSKL